MPNISVKMFIHRKMPPTKNISSQWERDSIERLLRPSKLNYSKHAFYSMKVPRRYGQTKKQRWEESKKRREEKRSEKRQRPKEKQARENIEKSRNPVSFQRFVAPEGRKVGSLKWRVRSPLAR